MALSKHLYSHQNSPSLLSSVCVCMTVFLSLSLPPGSKRQKCIQHSRCGSATRNAQSSSSLLADTNERTNRQCRIIYRFKSAIYLTAFIPHRKPRGTKSTRARPLLSGNNNEVSRFVEYCVAFAH